jgi:hypothetical protein
MQSEHTKTITIDALLTYFFTWFSWCPRKKVLIGGQLFPTIGMHMN